MAQERSKRVWTVVYEDQEGRGDPSVYPTKRAALARVEELLEGLVRDAFDDYGPDPDLDEIRNSMQDKAIEVALDQWNYLGADQKIHLEDGTFYPPKTAREW